MAGRDLGANKVAVGTKSSFSNILDLKRLRAIHTGLSVGLRGGLRAGGRNVGVPGIQETGDRRRPPRESHIGRSATEASKAAREVAASDMGQQHRVSKKHRERRNLNGKLALAQTQQRDSAVGGGSRDAAENYGAHRAGHR